MEKPLDGAGQPINRKDFLRAGTIGALSLGLGIGPVRADGEKAPGKAQGRNAVVALARDKALTTPEGLQDEKAMARALESALCAYTGKKTAAESLSIFVNSGDRVGIKMNVMMTATQPALVSALVRSLLELGVAEKNIIVWDRDSAGRGLEGALKREEKFGFGADNISRIITENADVIINMPGLKTHWLSGVAGALKNWAGAVTKINVRDTDTPFVIHADSCADLGMLAALEPIRSRCRLTILDATRPLYEGGPQVNPAYLWHYGGVFVAGDQVAVDRIGLELITRKREAVKGREWPINPPPKHIEIADTKYGLGVSEREAITLRAVGEEEGRLI